MGDEPLDLARLVSMARAGAEAIGPTLAPDGDWSTVVLADSPRGVAVLQFAHATQADREWMLAAITLQLRGLRARLAALVQATWVVERQASSASGIDAAMAEARAAAQPYGWVAAHPDRTEAVSITGVNATGAVMWARAPVTRHDGAPPTLGAWETSEANPVVVIAGDFLDALRRGVGAPT